MVAVVRQRGVQLGDQRADVGCRSGSSGRRSRAASVIRSTAQVQPSTAPGRYSSTLATSVSAPSGGRQVTNPHGAGIPREPGVAQHADPSRRRVRALLEVGRPLDHRRVADDHRLVGLVDADRPLTDARSPRPRPHGESARRHRPVDARPAVAAGPRRRRRPGVRAATPRRVADHRDRGQTVGVGDDRKALALSEFERVERRQSTDARCSRAHPLDDVGAHPQAVAGADRGARSRRAGCAARCRPSSRSTASVSSASANP